MRRTADHESENVVSRGTLSVLPPHPASPGSCPFSASGAHAAGREPRRLAPNRESEGSDQGLASGTAACLRAEPHAPGAAGTRPRAMGTLPSSRSCRHGSATGSALCLEVCLLGLFWVWFIKPVCVSI